MTSPRDLAVALADQIAANTDLRVSPNPVEQVNPPMAVVMLRRIDFNQGGMGRNIVAHRFRIDVVMARSWSDEGWKQLQTYMGKQAGSVLHAIESDGTLGGIAEGLALDYGVDIGSTLQQDSPFVVGSLEVMVYA